MATLVLKPERQKSLHRRHPWIFSGAVRELIGNAIIGDEVIVVDNHGEFLATASYNPNSQIIGRVWSFDSGEKIDRSFFERRLLKAIGLRKRLIPSFNTHAAVRLVHAESDGIPGLIVDQYANVLVAQFLAAGVEFWKETICDLLIEHSGQELIFERSDVEARRLEGFSLKTGLLRGTKLPDRTVIEENRIQFLVNIPHGHKTGFYIDQRMNRAKIRQYADGKDVLDCFCYSGGFTTNALLGGAKSIVSVDSSVEALSLLQKNLQLNNLNQELVKMIDGDVFQVLRQFRDRGTTFDLIILDPPKFAQTTSQSQKAARGYKDINLLALKLLRPGGILATFSCSGGVDIDLFQKIVAGAALDAGVEAKIIAYCYQDADHPVALEFPEGAYLKGLILYVS